MSTLSISNYDAATGQLEITEMTAAEKKQYQEDIERQQNKLEEDARIKNAALSKLAALGLTSDDVKALGLQLCKYGDKR